MNILFLTLGKFDNIEDTGIYTDLLRQFKQNGHEIYVASTNERRKKEPTKIVKQNGIHNLKVRIGNITKVNLIEKGISTLLIERIFLQAILKYYADVRFDLILYSTPPITFTKVVEHLKKRDQAKTYLLLKDIFPQNAVDLKLFSKTNPIHYYFRRKEQKLYEISDVIGCMSEANRAYIIKNNDIHLNKVEINPNTIQPKTINIDEDLKYMIREKYDIPHDKTIFIYGGNLGRPQGMDYILECVKANEENRNSFILIVGSGTEFAKAEAFFKTHELKNARLLNALPKDEYEILANTCDVGLIFLDSRFTIPNFPSRLLSYMQASMPVIAATDVNTDIGDVIMEGEFGYWCESKDVKVFNNLLNKMNHVKKREKMGQKARNYLEENYQVERSYREIMKHFEKETVEGDYYV